ncbi:hypothetical protein NQ317_014948 [Molorchus minor]|uniref:Uncharacterized protein n=1 Tax=Molorchus minor TaxID=1323400 RepID=A0ABQ9JZG2_9CUCU|nr:hypothetical protein NQ317_014948 [Molorchus minor]
MVLNCRVTRLKQLQRVSIVSSNSEDEWIEKTTDIKKKAKHKKKHKKEKHKKHKSDKKDHKGARMVKHLVKTVFKNLAIEMCYSKAFSFV